MESPVRSLELPAGLDGPTRCRCRLGSQHEREVRIAPEAKIASLRKPGLPRGGPTGWMPDHSSPHKVARPAKEFKSDFSMSRDEAIARAGPILRQADGRPAPDGPADKRLPAESLRRHAPESIASAALSGSARHAAAARDYGTSARLSPKLAISYSLYGITSE
jgi:hypothetical protein